MRTPKLENMESENVSSNGEFTEFGGKTAQKIRVSDHITGLQHTNRPDSFVVEMERFSHLTEKDMNANSRITRSQPRKGSVRGSEKKINENSIIIASSSSPRAASHGASTPEKPMIVTAGAAADYPALQPFNQITVVTAGDISSSPTERKFGDKRFGFRRLPSTSWTLHPRRILLFFATLSSMGTILLIYFTLSIGTKLGGDETALN